MGIKLLTIVGVWGTVARDPMQFIEVSPLEPTWRDTVLKTINRCIFAYLPDIVTIDNVRCDFGTKKPYCFESWDALLEKIPSIRCIVDRDPSFSVVLKSTGNGQSGRDFYLYFGVK